MALITFDSITKNEKIKTYIKNADKYLEAIGYTEHSFAHVVSVAEKAGYILQTLGFDERTVEITKIAGYMHDIGNLVNRFEHSQSGAVMAFRLLDNMGMDPEEVCQITSAIGNHDEGTGFPASPIAAALIIADKSDVRRSRVRNEDFSTFDIHDRVNYSVTTQNLSIDNDKKNITLNLTIETSIVTVMEYFEIFLQRMVMCRKAAETLNLKFKLVINGQCLE